MRIDQEIIEETATLLLEKYQLSTNFINKWMENCNIKDCEAIVGKVGAKEKLKLIIAGKGTLIFRGKEATEIREKIIDKWDDKSIDQCFNRFKSKERDNQRARKVNKLAHSNWHSGGPWARAFILSSGFNNLFAGLVNEEDTRKELEEVEPRRPLPELKEYQIHLKQCLIENLHENGDSAKCLISLPTGGGKTRIAVEAYLEWLRPRFSQGQYLIWIAQSEELCEQAIDSFKQVWTSIEFPEKLRIYRNFGKFNLKEDKLMGGVVICSINKLYNPISEGKIPEEYHILFDDCGAMIIDEAHRSTTKMYQCIYDFALQKRGENLFPICGLTATPSRTIGKDELTKLFRLKLIIPPLDTEYENNPILYFRKQGFLAIPKFINKKTGISVKIDLKGNEIKAIKEQIQEFFSSNKTQKELASNIQRNKLIIETLEKITVGEQTLVYCCGVEHAKLLSAAMNYKGRSSVVVSADTPASIRYMYINQFKNGVIDFIFNHSVLTTGFDAPKTQNIVLCRPIFSVILYEQIVGRGLRGKAFGGTDFCTIYDFDDNYGIHGDQKAYHRFKKEWQVHD